MQSRCGCLLPGGTLQDHLKWPNSAWALVGQNAEAGRVSYGKQTSVTVFLSVKAKRNSCGGGSKRSEPKRSAAQPLGRPARLWGWWRRAGAAV